MAAPRNLQTILGQMQKTLECAICLEMMTNPVSTLCGHRFCRFCLMQFLERKKQVPCPLCKKPITKRSLRGRDELGEMVSGVRNLISAFQTDTGAIFSPLRGPQESLLPGTPEDIKARTSGRRSDSEKCTVARNLRRSSIESAPKAKVETLVTSDEQNELLKYIEQGDLGVTNGKTECLKKIDSSETEFHEKANIIEDANRTRDNQLKATRSSLKGRIHTVPKISNQTSDVKNELQAGSLSDGISANKEGSVNCSDCISLDNVTSSKQSNKIDQDMTQALKCSKSSVSNVSDKDVKDKEKELTEYVHKHVNNMSQVSQNENISNDVPVLSGTSIANESETSSGPLFRTPLETKHRIKPCLEADVDTKKGSKRSLRSKQTKLEKVCGDETGENLTPEMDLKFDQDREIQKTYCKKDKETFIKEKKVVQKVSEWLKHIPEKSVEGKEKSFTDEKIVSTATAQRVNKKTLKVKAEEEAMGKRIKHLAEKIQAQNKDMLFGFDDFEDGIAENTPKVADGSNNIIEGKTTVLGGQSNDVEGTVEVIEQIVSEEKSCIEKNHDLESKLISDSEHKTLPGESTSDVYKESDRETGTKDISNINDSNTNAVPVPRKRIFKTKTPRTVPSLPKKVPTEVIDSDSEIAGSKYPTDDIGNGETADEQMKSSSVSKGKKPIYATASDERTLNASDPYEFQSSQPTPKKKTKTKGKSNRTQKKNSLPSKNIKKTVKISNKNRLVVKDNQLTEISNFKDWNKDLVPQKTILKNNKVLNAKQNTEMKKITDELNQAEDYDLLTCTQDAIERIDKENMKSVRFTEPLISDFIYTGHVDILGYRVAKQEFKSASKQSDSVESETQKETVNDNSDTDNNRGTEQFVKSVDPEQPDETNEKLKTKMKATYNANEEPTHMDRDEESDDLSEDYRFHDDSSGTDELDIEPTPDMFEDPDIEIQPEEIKVAILSQVPNTTAPKIVTSTLSPQVDIEETPDNFRVPKFHMSKKVKTDFVAETPEIGVIEETPVLFNVPKFNRMSRSLKISKSPQVNCVKETPDLFNVPKFKKTERKSKTSGEPKASKDNVNTFTSPELWKTSKNSQSDTCTDVNVVDTYLKDSADDQYSSSERLGRKRSSQKEKSAKTLEVLDDTAHARSHLEEESSDVCLVAVPIDENYVNQVPETPFLEIVDDVNGSCYDIEVDSDITQSPSMKETADEMINVTDKVEHEEEEDVQPNFETEGSKCSSENQTDTQNSESLIRPKVSPAKIVREKVEVKSIEVDTDENDGSTTKAKEEPIRKKRKCFMLNDNESLDFGSLGDSDVIDLISNESETVKRPKHKRTSRLRRSPKSQGNIKAIQKEDVQNKESNQVKDSKDVFADTRSDIERNSDNDYSQKRAHEDFESVEFIPDTETQSVNSEKNVYQVNKHGKRESATESIQFISDSIGYVVTGKSVEKVDTRNETFSASLGLSLLQSAEPIDDVNVVNSMRGVDNSLEVVDTVEELKLTPLTVDEKFDSQVSTLDPQTVVTQEESDLQETVNEKEEKMMTQQNTSRRKRKRSQSMRKGKKQKKSEYADKQRIDLSSENSMSAESRHSGKEKSQIVIEETESENINRHEVSQVQQAKNKEQANYYSNTDQLLENRKNAEIGNRISKQSNQGNDKVRHLSGMLISPNSSFTNGGINPSPEDIFLMESEMPTVDASPIDEPIQLVQLSPETDAYVTGNVIDLEKVSENDDNEKEQTCSGSQKGNVEHVNGKNMENNENDLSKQKESTKLKTLRGFAKKKNSLEAPSPSLDRSSSSISSKSPSNKTVRSFTPTKYKSPLAKQSPSMGASIKKKTVVIEDLNYNFDEKVTTNVKRKTLPLGSPSVNSSRSPVSTVKFSPNPSKYSPSLRKAKAQMEPEQIMQPSKTIPEIVEASAVHGNNQQNKSSPGEKSLSELKESDISEDELILSLDLLPDLDTDFGRAKKAKRCSGNSKKHSKARRCHSDEPDFLQDLETCSSSLLEGKKTVTQTESELKSPSKNYIVNVLTSEQFKNGKTHAPETVGVTLEDDANGTDTHKEDSDEENQTYVDFSILTEEKRELGTKDSANSLNSSSTSSEFRLDSSSEDDEESPEKKALNAISDYNKIKDQLNGNGVEDTVDDDQSNRTDSPALHNEKPGKVEVKDRNSNSDSFEKECEDIYSTRLDSSPLAAENVSETASQFVILESDLEDDNVIESLNDNIDDKETDHDDEVILKNIKTSRKRVKKMKVNVIDDEDSGNDEDNDYVVVSDNNGDTDNDIKITRTSKRVKETENDNENRDNDDDDDGNEDDDEDIRKTRTLKRVKRIESDSDDDNNDDEDQPNRRSRKSSMETDSGSDDEDDRNMTSSSAFSSQSENLTTQERYALEKDLERLAQERKAIEQQLKQHKSLKNHGEKKSDKSLEDPDDPVIVSADSDDETMAADDNAGDMDDDFNLSPPPVTLPVDTDCEVLHTVPDSNPSQGVRPALADIDINGEYPGSKNTSKAGSKDTSQAGKKRNLGFVVTGLTGAQMKLTRKLASLNDVKFFTKFNDAVTHVIVRQVDDDDRLCERTFKFFQGIAGKRWVVNINWVEDSHQAGYLLPESEYEIQGDTAFGHKHRGPQRSRLTKQGLFDNLTFLLIGDDECLSKESMLELVRLSGGELIHDFKALTECERSRTLVISCTDMEGEDEVEQREIIEAANEIYSHYGVVTLTREWILDGLTLFMKQSHTDYMVTSVSAS